MLLYNWKRTGEELSCVVKGQLTSMALSGKKVEFTAVVSTRADGVDSATKRLPVWNASTGQRMNVSPLQLDIKSHVKDTRSKLPTLGLTRAIFCDEVEADMLAVEADVLAEPRESRDLASEMLTARICCCHIARGDRIFVNMGGEYHQFLVRALPGSPWRRALDNMHDRGPRC